MPCNSQHLIKQKQSHGTKNYLGKFHTFQLVLLFTKFKYEYIMKLKNDPKECQFQCRFESGSCDIFTVNTYIPICHLSSELLFGNYYKAYGTCFFYRKCDVVNRGLSGYNSRWGRILLPHILPLDLLKDTVIATVFFGANDASLPEIAPDKYVSVEDYSANLKV